MNRELKKKFKNQEKEINRILNEWDFIPHSPEDEYDCLNHKIISLMNTGATIDELISLIRDELTYHFGLKEPEEKIVATGNKIFAWWQSNE